MSNTTYLITGASGHFGQLVLNSLIEDQGVTPSNIIATTRKPETLLAWADKGVQVRAADFDDKENLETAFAGADRLLLISTDALVGGKRVAQHTNAVAAAKAAGVKQIYYTSMPEPETSLITFALDHLSTESAIKASGLAYTILRNSWYAENLLHSVPSALKSGSWYSAAGQGKTAYIPRAEQAYATAIALVKGGETAGKTYTLTGVEGLTNETIASLVSAATGKPLTVVHVPVQAIVEGMVAHGFPAPVAEVFASFDTATAAGNLAGITSDFKDITGRDPQSFGEWLKANVQVFA